MKTALALTLGFLVTTFASAVRADDGPRYSHTGPTMITGVRVIDGLGGEPKVNQDIVLIDGKIASIEAAGTYDAPKDALVINGKGMTAMPGLIDAHVHIQGGWANGLIRGERYAVSYEDDKVQQRLSGYLYAGVTTVLDVGNDHDWVVKTRDKINSGKLFGPRAFVCGAAWSQAPSGWDSGGTSGDFGLSIKVTSIGQIPKQMDRYVKDGIEIIKLYSGISPLAAQEVVKEAHKRKIRVVADFWGLNLNRGIMQNTGLDGWAHSGAFVNVHADDHKWMADNNRFVIATANVGEKLAGARVKDEKGARLMAKEPLILDIWGKKALTDFYSVYPQIRREYYEGPDSFYQKSNFGDLSGFRDTMLHNIKASYDAGVLIAGGTDDIYASLWPGESMHREMQLLVMAGIPPLQAIKCCTYNGAKVLRREKKFGTLQKGLSADLLIVEGNPAKNISDTRNVKHVFLRGKQVDRESLKFKK
jgi:imidazolonepropionase-like amidohydrolase